MTTTKSKTKSDRRTFRWQCWYDGVLTEVVICPNVDDKKNIERGGIRGRIYVKGDSTVSTIEGVVKQDGEGKVYFVKN